LQLTICLVTARACARSAPSQLAAENYVERTWRSRRVELPDLGVGSESAALIERIPEHVGAD